ncbi:hypothetical protein GCM10022220_17160 [Actinocatenispora rupis]|uniref:Uncharacterized protein n=1 Tax=Actinocatenispora rupis TaxID=519421 RepID=A0A8J3IUV4_9ACTN|nr:hypothetical protein Aru02nite_12350 [Actinocatenispora rupis]
MHAVHDRADDEYDEDRAGVGQVRPAALRTADQSEHGAVPAADTPGTRAGRTARTSYRTNATTDVEPRIGPGYASGAAGRGTAAGTYRTGRNGSQGCRSRAGWDARYGLRSVGWIPARIGRCGRADRRAVHVSGAGRLEE